MCLRQAKLIHAHLNNLGLIWDKSVSHDSDEVKDCVEILNEEVLPKMHLEFFDAGLAPIYSPADIMIIKQAKKHVKNECEKLIFGRSGNDSRKPVLSRNYVV